MNTPKDIKKQLVDVEDSILVIIDIQNSFLTKYDPAISDALVERVAWILQVAQHLNVPVIAMAEDMNNAGPLNPAILSALPEGLKVHNKNCFNRAIKRRCTAPFDSRT